MRNEEQYICQNVELALSVTCFYYKDPKRSPFKDCIKDFFKGVDIVAGDHDHGYATVNYQILIMVAASYTSLLNALACKMSDQLHNLTPVLEKASKSVWELILDNSGLGKEISETVEKVFCRLSGQELPLFPPIPPKEKNNKKEEEKEEAIASLRDKSASKMKKRRHSEMNKESQQWTEVAAKKSADLPPPPQQDRPSKSPPTSKTS
ncbi:hypothetical protein LINPERPRIM_LOCUS1631 [Linum perenne]